MMKISRRKIITFLCAFIVVFVIVENILLCIVLSDNSNRTSKTEREAIFVQEIELQHKFSAVPSLSQPNNTLRKRSYGSYTPPNSSWPHNVFVYRKKSSFRGNLSRLETKEVPVVWRESKRNVADDWKMSDDRKTIDNGNVSWNIVKVVSFTQRKDYDFYADLGQYGDEVENNLPFYTNDSWLTPDKVAPVPKHIVALFPTNMSNTTLLYAPHHDELKFKPFNDVLTDKNLDIFKLLTRWGNLSLPFFSKKTPRLKIMASSTQQAPPTPRSCTLSPGIHLQKKHKSFRWRRNVECYKQQRELTPFELNGNHILFTMRTAAMFHTRRLPLLFQTWLANVNRSNVVIVTDGLDPTLVYRATEAGLKYLVSVPGYKKLCDKAGDEMSLMFLPENRQYEWLCHVDDDMYVNLDMLVSVLARFKRDEPVYFGRAGTKPGEPRRVLKEARVGTPGTPYNFAVGGMYCLSRAILTKARRWIGSRDAFQTMCSLTNEPEDVTVGFVVGIMLGLDLSQTGLIHSHGNDLYGVNPTSLKYQVGISYGFGTVHWGFRPNNVISVPNHLFSLEEDPSQFLSLHCHYHRHIGWCINRERISFRSKHPLAMT